MKNLSLVLFVVLTVYFNLDAQQLPLKLGNQWHYNLVFNPMENYAAIAVDTVTIDGKTYFKLERRLWNTGWHFATTYDRFEGDSIYYRYNSGGDDVIINFNWQPGYVYETQLDSICFELKRLDYIDTSSVLGMNALRYWFSIGFYCEGFADTAWVLEPTIIHSYFGSYYSGDGYLIGAIIDSTTYGVLHPLPIELASFTASVKGNDVTLNWMTASEINNQGFEVERQLGSRQSAAGNWERIGFVDGKGTTTELNRYSYVDRSLSPGLYQYRIKQIDFDGTVEYYNLAETIEIGLPTEFILEQNYPNPFNPTTVIRYQLSVNSYITLRVYDVLGNELNTLVNEYKPAGSYEVEFDASALTSGVYFYKLQSGGSILTKKMLILK
jgi:hypothetical protein